MRTIAIGDIHGCFDEFCALQEKIKLNLPEDRLILLGDYIDRGAKSYEIIQEIRKLQETYGSDQVICLRGNHEQMAIDYFEHHSPSYLYNGGPEAIKSFRKHQDGLQHYIGFFKSFPLYYEDDDFIYVHGGLRPGVPLQSQDEEDLLWIREPFLLSSYPFEKTVIFGHTPTLFLNDTVKPLFLPSKIALDTGCVYGGRLSALEICEGKITEIYQVNNQRHPRIHSIA